MTPTDIKTSGPVSGPHQGMPFSEAGAPPSRAKAAMIMLHGRGAEAKGILQFSEEFAQPDVRYLAPQAASHTWYPYPFTEPQKKNQPWLDSALNRVDELILRLISEGILQEKIVLLGFSQGACLALEYAARNPGKYGGIIAWSGALIGEDPGKNSYKAGLEKTPVFMGVGEQEHYFSMDRFNQTCKIMENLGADLEQRVYPGKGHTIVEDEVKYVRGLLSGLIF